ncbi:hypothetical protein ACWD8I_03460 [Micromonospora arida]
MAALLPAAPAVATSVGLKAAALNIYYGLSQADFAHDLNLIASKADLVGLNEVGARKTFLTSWAADNGWWLYAPGGTNQAGEALIAKKSMFDVLDKGSTSSVTPTVRARCRPRGTTTGSSTGTRPVAAT